MSQTARSARPPAVAPAVGRRSRQPAAAPAFAGPLAAAVATVLAAALAAACASAPAPKPAPAPPPAVPAPPPAPPAGAAPWEIPSEKLASQRLYRLRYQGPDGEGGLRLTLSLAAPEHYRARAVDLLGRPLWSLSFEGTGGLWVDHRAGVFCRLRDRLDLAGLPLAPFPLAALPALLLGRLPARPAPGSEPAPGAEALDFRDLQGRRWTATLAGGAPASWTLWDADPAAGPLITWLAADGEAVLSDRAAGRQLRWREVVAEPLTGPPGPVEPPAGYRETSCPDAAAAVSGRRFDSFPPRL